MITAICAVDAADRYNCSCTLFLTMAKKKTIRERATTPDTHVAEADRTPAVLSKTARDTANDMQTQSDRSTPHVPTFEQISEAAYHRYLQRGGQHGHDFDDWLEAERSLRSRS